MPEDLSQALSLESAPDPQQPAPVVEHEDDDSEPEGVVEVTPGRRMVDVSVVAAERKRARETATRQVREKELAPLQEKAKQVDALQQALNAAKPYVELVQQNQHLLRKPEPTPLEQQISDDDAAQEARDLQLYTKDSQLDIATAKKIIARRRTETAQAATEAAQQAVAPIQAATATDRSRQNFAQMAALRDSDGRPLVDPQILAAEWVQLPADLTQHPQVAEVVLERAIGKSLRQGKRVSPPAREPVFSESPGGRGPSPVVLTDLDRKLGLTEKDLKASAGKFVAGGISVIGD